jgi:hypothetical protein
LAQAPERSGVLNAKLYEQFLVSGLGNSLGYKALFLMALAGPGERPTGEAKFIFQEMN